MPDQDDKFPVDWDYYLDVHVINKAQSLLDKAKTTIKFSKIKEEKTQRDLEACIHKVYQTLGLLYSPEASQPETVNPVHTETQ